MKNDERIRFGGRSTPAGFLFELTGGDPALDLANTVFDRGAEEPEELLWTYADLVNWGRQATVIDDAEVATLLRKARRDPAEAARALRRAIAFRESLFAVFGEHDLGEAQLRAIGGLANEALRHRSLVAEGPEVKWEWERGSLDGILWRVAASGAALLTSERRSRIRMCAGEPCRWLFVDDSRRGNRRWCDMTVCGNRAKARRHYAKIRGGKGE